MSSIEFQEYPDLNSLSIFAVKYFVDLHNSSKRQTFLVPGGQTPFLFYKHLARTIDNWSGISLLLSDERLVPQEDIMSNVGMVKEKIFENIKAKNSPDIIEYFNTTNLINPDQILASINNSRKKIFPLTAAFLGIGTDGHTASLFPGFEKLFFNSHPFIKIKRSSESFSRITVSANVLINTPNLFFLVSGLDKRNILNKIIKNSSSKDFFPVKTIINKAKGKVVILCDKDATLS